MRLTGLFICLTAVFCASQVQADVPELVLVKDGQSVAPIIIPEDMPPLTRLAVDDLVDVIERTSGARPTVVEGTPDPLPDKAIWVGHQPVLEKLFPSQDFQFEHPEEILIVAEGQHLAILGRDRWDPDHLVVKTSRTTIRGMQQEYGTANALYTFMQRHLGVRWLWPADWGVDVVASPTIALQPFVYRYHPQVRARAGLFSFSALGQSRGLGHDGWARRQRLQLDSLPIGGGHAFTHWWDRFHETHPEYFALQPDGTRTPVSTPRTVKLCQSNPAVWDAWLDDVASQLEANPNQTVFNGSPNDGYNSGICVCESCCAWDDPDGAPATYHWKGSSRNYVAMSDRYITFGNHLAKKLKEKYPDRDYFVLMQAYGNAYQPPVKARPANNVIIQHVSYFPWQEPMRGDSKPVWRAWAGISHAMVYRPNTGSPVGWQWGMPEIMLEKTIDDWRFLREHKWMGIFVDRVWEHWATQGPQYYLMAQLTWNPQADGQAIMDDYYQRGFGPAASHIKAYWQFLEDTRNAFAMKYGNTVSRPYVHEVYTDDLLDQAQAFLDQADQAVANADEKYRKRIAFVRSGLTWTRLLVGTRALMHQYEKTNPKDDALKQQVLDRWELMRQFHEKHPDAVNFRFLGNHPQTGGRTAGLHPDNPWNWKRYGPSPRKPDGLDMD